MKILHTADLHFTNKPQLLADIVKCGDFLTDFANNEKPDLIVIAGDLYDEGVQLGSPASLEAIDFVYRCGMIAPVLVIRGTTSHDAEGSIEPLNKLRTAYPVYATDQIEQICLYHAAHSAFFDVPRDAQLLPDVIISCLPSVNKANVVSCCAGSSITDTGREAIDLVRDVLQSWGIINDRARGAGIPTILVGHGTITGSQLSTGQTMAGRDLEYTTGDLRLARCDLNVLGHIHKAQSWGNVFYSGSLTRLNYGEVEGKGFYLHEISGDGGPVRSRFIETPARSMRTKRPEGLPTLETVADVQDGELVRIVYEIAEEDVGKVDEQAIIDAALARGAVDVKIEKTVIPTVRVRAEGISREHTLLSKLQTWGDTTGKDITVSLAEKLALLEESEIETIVNTYKESTDEANRVAA